MGWTFTCLSSGRDQRGEEKDDDDDYENMAPSYKDLPPKPGKRTSQGPDKEMCGLWVRRGVRSPGDISWPL